MFRRLRQKWRKALWRRDVRKRGGDPDAAERTMEDMTRWAKAAYHGRPVPSEVNLTRAQFDAMKASRPPAASPAYLGNPMGGFAALMGIPIHVVDTQKESTFPHWRPTP